MLNLLNYCIALHYIALVNAVEYTVAHQREVCCKLQDIKDKYNPFIIYLHFKNLNNLDNLDSLTNLYRLTCLM